MFLTAGKPVLSYIFLTREGLNMPTSFITDRFVLDDKGAERLIEIIENTKAHPVKRTFNSNKYEEGKRLLNKYFPCPNQNDD